MGESKSFFQTLPGILTGLAAVIGAITGLYLALKGEPVQTSSSQSSHPATATDYTETSDFAEQIRGIWVNANPGTRGVTKIVILRKYGDVFVHAWGKCRPQDCDWGEAKGMVEGELLKVTWPWRGGDRDMSISLEGERLRTETINVYDDDRSPRRSTESFVKTP